MMGLTKKQGAILDFIAIAIDRDHMPPTVAEIAEEFGVKGATAFAHLTALQSKGFIIRTRKARSIRVIKRGT